MPASGSRFEFPELFQDIWNQHRLLPAKKTEDVPGTSGCSRWSYPGSACEEEVKGLGWLVRSWG